MFTSKLKISTSICIVILLCNANCGKTSGYAVSKNGGPQLSIVGRYLNGRSIAVDSHKNVFVADLNNNQILKFTSTGTQSVFASISTYMLTMDKNDNLYSVPWPGGNLSKISPAGAVSTVGTVDASVDGLTVDLSGNIYFTSSPGNASTNVVKMMTPGGVVSVFAGSGGAVSTNANGASASFNSPQGIVADGSGNIFVVDAENSLIRKITPAGEVTTFSGSGIPGIENGPATAASFSFRNTGAEPTGIGISSSGDLYVGEGYGVGLLRKVDSFGTVSNFCGDGSDAGAVVAGPCSQSPLYQDGTVTVGIDGSVYFNDGYKDLVRISN